MALRACLNFIFLKSNYENNERWPENLVRTASRGCSGQWGEA